jgi:hypothetical protein
MTSRDRILERVRAGTNNAPEYQRPPTPQVWPETRISQKQLLERFRSELHAVGGESFLCTSMIHGAQKLAELAEEHRWNKIGVADRPLCHALTARLPYHTLLFERSNWDPAEMAGLSVGLVAADAFLADTGSALKRFRSPKIFPRCGEPLATDLAKEKGVVNTLSLPDRVEARISRRNSFSVYTVHNA